MDATLSHDSHSSVTDVEHWFALRVGLVLLAYGAARRSVSCVCLGLASGPLLPRITGHLARLIVMRPDGSGDKQVRITRCPGPDPKGDARSHDVVSSPERWPGAQIPEKPVPARQDDSVLACGIPTDLPNGELDHSFMVSSTDAKDD
jgi:hypothetical protein